MRKKERVRGGKLGAWMGFGAKAQGRVVCVSSSNSDDSCAFNAPQLPALLLLIAQTACPRSRLVSLLVGLRMLVCDVIHAPTPLPFR